MPPREIVPYQEGSRNYPPQWRQRVESVLTREALSYRQRHVLPPIKAGGFETAARVVGHCFFAAVSQLPSLPEKEKDIKSVLSKAMSDRRTYLDHADALIHGLENNGYDLGINPDLVVKARNELFHKHELPVLPDTNKLVALVETRESLTGSLAEAALTKLMGGGEAVTPEKIQSFIFTARRRALLLRGMMAAAIGIINGQRINPLYIEDKDLKELEGVFLRTDIDRVIADAAFFLAQKEFPAENTAHVVDLFTDYGKQIVRTVLRWSQSVDTADFQNHPAKFFQKNRALLAPLPISPFILDEQFNFDPGLVRNRPGTPNLWQEGAVFDHEKIPSEKIIREAIRLLESNPGAGTKNLINRLNAGLIAWDKYEAAMKLSDCRLRDCEKTIESSIAAGVASDAGTEPTVDAAVLAFDRRRLDSLKSKVIGYQKTLDGNEREKISAPSSGSEGTYSKWWILKARRLTEKRIAEINRKIDLEESLLRRPGWRSLYQDRLSQTGIFRLEEELKLVQELRQNLDAATDDKVSAFFGIDNRQLREFVRDWLAVKTGYFQRHTDEEAMLLKALVELERDDRFSPGLAGWVKNDLESATAEIEKIIDMYCEADELETVKKTLDAAGFLIESDYNRARSMIESVLEAGTTQESELSAKQSMISVVFDEEIRAATPQELLQAQELVRDYAVSKARRIDLRLPPKDAVSVTFSDKKSRLVETQQTILRGKKPKEPPRGAVFLEKLEACIDNPILVFERADGLTLRGYMEALRRRVRRIEALQYQEGAEAEFKSLSEKVSAMEQAIERNKNRWQLETARQMQKDYEELRANATQRFIANMRELGLTLDMAGSA